MLARQHKRRPTAAAIAAAAAAAAAAVFALGCASAAGTPAASPQGGLRSLIAAERAFARHSERAGVKESFVANLGPDGILFRPGPVNGLEWFRNRPAAPGYLSWEPEVAVLSASGELGYTTGPWEFRARTAADTVSGAGHYVTVWRRDSTGTWKIAVDIGTAHRWIERPLDAVGAVLRAAITLGGDAQRALFARDSAIGKRGEPQQATLPAAMASDARLQRDGTLPALGSDAARAALRGDDRPYHSNPLGGGVSRAGDFGYTYGAYELVATFLKAAERGFYLRIWRADEAGQWQVLLDLAQPVRAPG